MNTLIRDQSNTINTKKTKVKAIDCDVHPVVHGGLSSLFPYMSRSWIEKFKMEGHDVSPNHRSRFPHPRGAVNRMDAAPSEGIIAGSNPDFVVTDHLDRSDIKYAILLALQPAKLSLVWTNADAINVAITAFNDYLIEHWLSKDSRFALAITVNPRDPELAVKEIKRLSKREGIAAILLPLTYTPLGDRYFYPIYEAAVEEGLPIMTHVSGAEGTYLGAPVTSGQPNSYAERYSLLPQIGQSNLASMVFEGVFEKYPELKMIFVEFGFSWLAPLMWRMDQSWKGLRIEIPWLKKSPSEYIAQNVFLTTQPMEDLPKKDMTHLLEMLNAKDNLLFSSDYPHWDNDMPDRAFFNIDAELRQRILHDNAMKVFNSRLRGE